MKKIFILIGLLFFIFVINVAGDCPPDCPIQIQISSPFGQNPVFNYISYDDLNWKKPEDQIILFNVVITKLNQSQEDNGEIRFTLRWNDVEANEVFKDYTLPLTLTNKDILRSSYIGDIFTVQGNLDDVFNELKPLVLDTGRIPDGSYTVEFAVVEKGYGNTPEYINHLLSNIAKLTFTVKSPMEITLISPGNPLSANPVEIFTKNPYFVWVSNFDEYTIKIWEETGNMNSMEQFENVTPYFSKILNITNFDYPSDAPPLRNGKTYAWQVVAKLRNSLIINNEENKEYQKSKIYHFKIVSSSSNSNDNVSVTVLENYLTNYKPAGWRNFLELLKEGYYIEQEDLDVIISRISSGKKIIRIEVE